MKNKNNYYLRGSFTVEAAIIIPLTLFLIFTVIYMSFYLHDQCVLHAISNQVVSELCFVQEKGGTFQQMEEESSSFVSSNFTMLGFILNEQEKVHIKEKIKEKLDKQLYVCSYLDSTVTSVMQKVEVSVKVDVNMPFYVKFFNIKASSLDIKAHGIVYQPTISTRAGDMIYSELQKTRLFDKVQNVFEKVKTYIF